VKIAKLAKQILLISSAVAINFAAASLCVKERKNSQQAHGTA